LVPLKKKRYIYLENTETKQQLEELKKKKIFASKKEKKLFGNIFHKCSDNDELEALERSEYSDPSNPLVYLDISLGDLPPERLIIELFANLVPKTAENFRALCTGERGKNQAGVPLHYKNSRFHLIKKDFIIEGGDIVKGDGIVLDITFPIDMIFKINITYHPRNWRRKCLWR
jgi:hypothetical protein